MTAPSAAGGDTAAVGETRQSLVAGARWLTVATIGVGLLNYLYSLGLTHLLDVGDFAVFAAGQALLLTAGSVATTSVPWILAQALVAADSPLARRQAITFALVTNSALALAAGLVLILLALAFAPTGPAVAVGAAGALIFLSSTTYGFLQGTERFALLGVTRTADALLKIVAGLLLVLAGMGATGALGGFALGALLVAAVGALLIGRDLRPAPGALKLRTLWRSAAGVAAIQALVSVLTTVDLVLVAVLAADAADAASYQASMILSRVPLFIAGTVSVVVFPLLARNPAGGGPLVHTAVRLYLALVLPYAVALMTVPADLLDLVFPPQYGAISTLLPMTAVAGAFIGGINLVTTAFQAQRRYVRCLRAQVAGFVLYIAALLIGAWSGGVVGLALGAVVRTAVSLGLLARTGSAVWPHALRPPPAMIVGCTTFAAVLLLVRDNTPLWLATAGTVGIVTAVRAFGSSGGVGTGPAEFIEGDGNVDGDRRLRILHLAFEDWRKPGSGGGAVRTREVNERLARHHDVTVLVTSYRGARERVEQGVRYVPVGLPLGYWGGILSYFAILPFAVRKRRADVLVEDFAAPIGSVLPRLWSRGRPLVAVVQWLDAEGKSQQYHLPFHRIQRAGVLRHDRFVAMSDDLAARLRQGNPAAEVTVIPNGVPTDAFTMTAARGTDIVFLGRLEIAQKGLDLLLPALGAVRDRLPGRIVLAGDGPDRRAVEKLVERAGLTDRVVFAGRVDGEEKLRLLAGARLVVMPSRYETFGMVAAEALACGTPVVAFEIPSLREVVAQGTGVLVPAFDVPALGQAVADLAADPARIEQFGARGRDHARQYDWDDVAQRQEAVYRQAVTEHPEVERKSR